MFAKIERYFLAEDRTEITTEDRIYFYGVYGVLGLVSAVVIGNVGFLW